MIPNLLLVCAMLQKLNSALAIGKIDLAPIVEEFSIADTGLPWAPQYGPYQNGGWHTCSLMNPAGRSSENVIADGLAQPTELMEQFPQLKKFLDSSHLKLMWVRLAKMSPDAALWEHVDYTELNAVKKFRIHIPIKTNSDAVLVFPGQAVHIACNHIWLLDPHSLRHAAVNRGSSNRVHLLLDVYADESLERLIANGQPIGQVCQLPTLSASQRTNLIERAARLAKLGFLTAANQLLLKSFLNYDLGAESSYDLLVELYSSDSLKGTENWTEIKNAHLGTQS